MLGRALARLLLSVALLAATVSWMGWLYLHTAGDPNRGDRIAHAVLDDPKARQELANDISDGIAAAANQAIRRNGGAATGVLVSGDDPELRSAVNAALADPRITANLIDAISAEHAIALGATPAHPAVIDTALLLSAVKAHLAAVDPNLANSLPPVKSGQIKLPTAKVPLAKKLRTLANHWVGLLALAAIVFGAAAFLIGDKVRIVRRAGVWGIGAGLTWAVIPPLITAIGNHFVKSQAAVIRAVVKGVAGSVTATATLLVVGGAGAVVGSYFGAQFLRAMRTGGGSPAATHRAAPAAPGSPPPHDTWTSGHVEEPTVVYTPPQGWSRRPGVRTNGPGDMGHPSPPQAP